MYFAARTFIASNQHLFIATKSKRKCYKLNRQFDARNNHWKNDLEDIHMYMPIVDPRLFIMQKNRIILGEYAISNSAVSRENK